jgi:hypothetical protein
MVRSNVRYPTPREDWAQLIAAPRTAPKDMAAVGDDVVVSSRCDPSSTDGRSGSRKLARTSTAAGLPPGSASRYRRGRHPRLYRRLVGAPGALVCCRPARAFPAQCEAWRTRSGHTLESMICANWKFAPFYHALRTRTAALRNQRFAGNQSQFPTSPTTSPTPLATDH